MFNLGPISINWYGFFISLGMLLAIIITIKLSKMHKLPKEKIIDLSFWLIIFGILGARIYDIFLELPFYLDNPGQIIKIWEGGLAIHGGILAGVLVLLFFAKLEKINFWILSAVSVPGLALAQSIGRFGNYFNQELFGLPTKLPWGIPIQQFNRPLEFITETHFHPTFLYESLGSFIIFLTLIFLIIKFNKKENGEIIKNSTLIVSVYMLLYSVLRFFLEFIRVDYSPVIIGLRAPQIFSLIMASIAIFIIIKNYVFSQKKII